MITVTITVYLLQDNQFLHMKPKGSHDTKEQQFQDLAERCERIEKMILKMGDEHRYYCQNCNEMIRFSSHSTSALRLDPRQSQYLNSENELDDGEAVTQPSIVVSFESQV
jgi:acetyl-CoA carboxylase beta subunit